MASFFKIAENNKKMAYSNRKLWVSFWDYLIDRIENKNVIPLLTDIMIAQMSNNFSSA